MEEKILKYFKILTETQFLIKGSSGLLLYKTEKNEGKYVLIDLNIYKTTEQVIDYILENLNTDEDYIKLIRKNKFKRLK
jgi:hypothetical protein